MIPSPRSNIGAAAVTLGLCLVLILILAHCRGLWLDEAAGFWLSSHDVRLGPVLYERWITDVHPPLYNVYAWAMRPLFGGSVAELRLINLGALPIAALVWRQAWRRGIDRDFLALFAVLVASSPFFILYGAEFRSYFPQLVFGACLIVQLRMIHEGRGGAGLLALVAIVAVNLHYYGSLPPLILIGAEAGYLLLARRWRACAGLLLLMAVATVPLAASAVAMLSAITPAPSNYTASGRALFAIAAAIGGILIPNLVAAGWLIARRPKPANPSFAIVLAAAAIAIAITFFLLNLANHNLVTRHLIGAAPILAGLGALLLEDVVRDRPQAFRLICANAALLAIAATGYGLVHKRWETNVAAIEGVRASCPATQVYALNTVSLLAPDDPKRDETSINAFFRLAYRLIAEKGGWTVTVLPDGKAIVPGGACPSLLWIEHFYMRQDLSDEQLARLAGFTGPLAVKRLQRGDARALLAIGVGR